MGETIRHEVEILIRQVLEMSQAKNDKVVGTETAEREWGSHLFLCQRISV